MLRFPLQADRTHPTGLRTRLIQLEIGLVRTGLVRSKLFDAATPSALRINRGKQPRRTELSVCSYRRFIVGLKNLRVSFQGFGNRGDPRDLLRGKKPFYHPHHRDPRFQLSET